MYRKEGKRSRGKKSVKDRAKAVERSSIFIANVRIRRNIFLNLR